MGKLVKLKRFNSITETELAKNLLKSHNIQAQIVNSGIEFPGDRGDAFGADLFVQEEDFEKAKEILEDSNKNQKTKLMQNEQQNLNQQFNQQSQPRAELIDKPKFNLKYILIVVILAVIVGGGTLALISWESKKEFKPLEPIVKDETADWQTYRNEEIGVSFSYPKFWGEVKVEEYDIKSSSKGTFFGERVVNGTQVALSFSVNDFLLLYFNSPDYKTVISTTKGEETPLEFTGKGEQLICEPFFLGITKVAECNPVNIGGSSAVEWYLGEQWVQACGYGLWKNLKIISPNEKFPGLSIRTLVLGIDYQAGCDEERTKFKPDISLEEFINLRIKQLKENQLPFAARQYLFEFDNFIKSIKFIK